MSDVPVVRTPQKGVTAMTSRVAPPVDTGLMGYGNFGGYGSKDAISTTAFRRLIDDPGGTDLYIRNPGLGNMVLLWMQCEIEARGTGTLGVRMRMEFEDSRPTDWNSVLPGENQLYIDHVTEFDKYPFAFNGWVGVPEIDYVSWDGYNNPDGDDPPVRPLHVAISACKIYDCVDYTIDNITWSAIVATSNPGHIMYWEPSS